MPYLFGLLVLANAGLLGYFIVLHNPNHEASADAAKAQVAQTLKYKNTSDQMPPLIGTKK